MRNDLLVLCYHAVSPSWPADLSVTPDTLEHQVAELARRGYRGARFSDALSAGPEGRVVSITFDDSYSSVLQLAKPILDRYGYPGTIFVPTDWPDGPCPMCWTGIDCWLDTPFESELSPLAWSELRELANAGWEVGSHTCSHPHLPELNEATLTRELCDSKAHIEAEIGEPCVSLAYPYGDLNTHVINAAHESGYRWACTIPRVLSSPRPLAWPRAAIYHDDNMRRFASKISPSLRRLRASHIGGWLDQARLVLSRP